MTELFKTDYNLNSLLQIQTKGTNLPFLVTPRFVSHYIDQEYESFSIELLQTYLKPESLFVDVGAHYGYYSVAAAAAGKNVAVTAVEPVPANYEILLKNLALNNVAVKETLNCAASDHNGETQFNMTEASDSAGFYQHPLTQTKEILTVKTLALDSVLVGSADKIDFIKIDVEGHELAVLQGLKKTLTKNKSIRLLIEFNPKCQISAGHAPEDLLIALSKQGYELFIINENNRQLYRLDEKELNWRQFIHPQSYANILCVPRNEALYVVAFSHTTNLAGAERSLLELADGLVKRGMFVHLVFPNSSGDFINALKGTGITYSDTYFTWWAGVTAKVRAEQLRYSLQNVLVHLSILKQLNPHCFYTNTGVIPWGALAADLMGKPHIWHLNEFIDKDHGLIPNLAIPQLSEYIEEKSDYVIANSKAVADYFQQFFKYKRILLQYYSISVTAVKTNYTPFTGKGNSVLKLLVLGAVQPGKGQDQAVSAVQQLLSEGKRIELKIVGDYKENSEYFQLLKKLAGDSKRISFIQKVTDPATYLHEADVLVMCSKQEAFGRVTVEAMLHGKPVVAAASGGSLEIVRDGQTGWLYQPNDIQNLKQKIEEYYINPSLLKKHGLAGQKRATKLFVENHYLEDSIKLFFQSKLLTKLQKPYAQFFGEIMCAVATKADELERHLLVQVAPLEVKEKQDFFTEASRLQLKLDRVKNSKLWPWLNAYFALKDKLTSLFSGRP